MANPANAGKVEEFTVRVPERKDNKNYHLMKFRNLLAGGKDDPSKWGQVRMIRENNKKEFKGPDEDMPKYGAGSEYGREEREEARRKKYGYSRRKYDPDMQPWLMRIGGKKDGKHYRGQREGAVSENTTFYVFTHAPDGSFEAHPIKEWYNFVPRVAHRTLDDEEAEERFAQRDKILSRWTQNLNKKLNPDQGADDDELDDEDNKKGKKKGGKKADNSFKIHDGSDFDELEDEMDSDSDDDKKKKKKEDSDDDQNTKKKGKGAGKKKKSKEDVKDEAFEDSDDGDGEGREIGYMSDESSEDEEVEDDKHDIHGVENAKGLSNMLDSDDSSEDEDGEKKKDNEEEDDKEDKNGKKEADDDKGGDKKSAKSSANNSRSGSPAPESKAGSDTKGNEKKVRDEKRKVMMDKLLDPNAGESASKRGRFEAGPSSAQPATNSVEASFEEDVRRYLARKPMTTTEILRKMTQKRPNFPKEDIMPLLVNILKRINPHKQKIKGQMYLTIKTGN